MRERILIRNADAVVTCDPADRVLYNSDILICGNRIEAVSYTHLTLPTKLEV